MDTSAPIPHDHPLWRAWNAHKVTPEYANSKCWAKHDEHVEGSLWALFMAGWMALDARCSALEQENVALRAEVERLQRELGECTGAMVEVLPYMRMHGERLANDYSPRTCDATRREGEALIAKAKLLSEINAASSGKD